MVGIRQCADSDLVQRFNSWRYTIWGRLRPVIEREKVVAAPDFNVQDSQGRRVKLSDYKDKKNVMLVFNRGFA